MNIETDNPWVASNQAYAAAQELLEILIDPDPTELALNFQEHTARIVYWEHLLIRPLADALKSNDSITRTAAAAALLLLADQWNLDLDDCILEECVRTLHDFQAGLMPAELRQIKRQQDNYKEVVHALSEGRIRQAFSEMDHQGWVREVSDEDRYKRLADDYINLTRHGESALVVSPTHREAAKVTQEIRNRLREAGSLTGKQREIPMLVNKNLTEAERGDSINYDDGDVLVYHQNATGHTKGERIKVGDAPLPFEQANRFQAYSSSAIELARGDLVRFTRNGTTIDRKHRINNGATYTLKRFDRQGNLVLNNGWVVAKDYGYLSHGYTSTSHASQGRTVHHVLIAQSSDSLAASDMRQWYVSVSRGKKTVTVYTDEKEALLDAVSKADERMSATELVQGQRSYHRVSVIQRDLDHDLSSQSNSYEPAREREEMIYE